MIISSEIDFMETWTFCEYCWARSGALEELFRFPIYIELVIHIRIGMYRRMVDHHGGNC
jgi:hypothetical protein